MARAKTQKLDRIEQSLNELSAHVVALTAVVGGIVTAAAVDYERLEECVNFAAARLRPGARPVLLAKAAAVLEEFETMQKVLRVEGRKNRGIKRSAPVRKRRAASDA